MSITGNDPHPRILVLRGSPDRTVADLADVIADELRVNGVRADVGFPSEIDGLGGYDGVVLGSMLLWRRWHPAAVRFLRRHAAVLRVRPLWLFQLDRHSRTAAAGALTGLETHRVPRFLPALLDGPLPVTFDPHADGLDPARAWARTVATSLTPAPQPVP